MKDRNKFSIRRCEDKELVKSLHEVIFPSDDFYDGETIDWVVYDKNGQPVGFCMLKLLAEEKAGYLARAGVSKAAQGKGLHTRLIRIREKYLRNLGYTLVITYTKIYNISSSFNLQKAGYWIYIPEDEYADADCIYWRKQLKSGRRLKGVKRK